MRLIHLTFCVLAFLQAGELIAENIKIEFPVQAVDSTYVELFAGHKFFPGQTIKLQIAGQIDVNHAYWEERRCNWFGINCWYEQRDEPHNFGPEHYPVLVRAIPPKGSSLSSPVMIQDSSLEAGGGPFISFVAKQNPQTVEFTIDFPESGTNLSVFGAGASLVAKIADIGPGGNIIRTSCVSRVPCSSDQYIISVKNQSNEKRLNLLLELLKTTQTASAVIAALDRSFLEDERVKTKIAEALFSHAEGKHGGPEPTSDYIAYLEFASNLAPNALSGAIGNKLSNAYLKSGNVILAKDKANDNHVRLAQLFKEKPDDTSVRLEYAENLRILGQVQLRGRNGLYSTDLTRAIALFIDASRVAVAAADKVMLPRAERRALYIVAKEASIDCARALMMLRTAPNLVRAESIATAAIDYATKAAALR